jgi:UDP-2-acetamido-3-amino-2,3-dideoxy-glucuronate N-acetyltransferase
MTDSKPSAPSWVRVITEVDGLLGVMEFAGLPFVPKRFFWLSAIDGNAIRADHAHRTCYQMLVCLAGSLTATITNIGNEVVIYSMSAGTTIHLEPLHWLELSSFSTDSVLGVMASEPYDENEYITERSEFFGLSN